jgi:hypothetical protein
MVQVSPVVKKSDVTEVPNKVGHHEFQRLSPNGIPNTGDAAWQQTDATFMSQTPPPVWNFDGISNINGSLPPDTQGDVGPDNYFQVVNSSFAIYSRTGTILMGPSNLSTIWNGIPAPWNGTNSGDPIVLYDQAAGRWIVSQFSLPTNSFAELVAISQTSDPTGSWYRYVFQFGTTMPDYPKLAVWPDGYYMSVNQFANMSTWGGVGACAFDRTKMIAGDPTASMVYFDLGASSVPESMLPSDWDGATAPVAGEPNHFLYFNDWTSATEDYLKMWDFHVDWATPANSTFTETFSLVTDPFDSELCTAPRGRCVPQPGTTIKLESLSDRLMYRLQYRNFGTHRSMVANHTVDVNGAGRAGVRWYELRNTGSGWSIHQQGTWSPDAANRWMGSVAMNSLGDIALGYSVSDATSTYPSIRYTGRKSTDPPGQMTVTEQNIIAGSGSQTYYESRWGDYSMMSVDPNDDKTFWYTTEYMQTTGATNWQTRIASFMLENRPIVATLAYSAMNATSVTIEGTVNPNTLATTYYFQWGTTTAYGNTTTVTSAGSGNTSLPVNTTLTGLTLGQVYHYRIVATNADGTTEGNNMSFAPGTAVLTTTTATSISSNGATTGGKVTFDGGAAITARGVCWGTTANPEITGSYTTDGAGTGSFTSTLTGLLSNTLYHIRAYATNVTGTYYGEDKTFTTLCGIYDLPLSENFSLATFPVCWSQQGAGTGIVDRWTVSATANAGGTANEMRSQRQSVNPGTTRLVTKAINTLGFSQLNLSFRHMLDAYSTGATLKVQSSANGVTWTDEAWSVPVTSANIPAVQVSTTVLSNLNQPATYIAFVVTGNLNRYDYWYIDDVSVTGTLNNLPIVATAAVTGITQTGAVSGGNVTSGGASAVTARGVCWGPAINPDTSGYHTTDGSGTGVFSSAMAGLSPGSTYYVRAYATNSQGTAYGDNVMFNTDCGLVLPPYSQPFSGVVIPVCWSQVDHQGLGQIWMFGTITGYTPNPNLTGNYAYLNSDAYGTSNTQNADLVSPAFDLSLFTSVTLQFNHYFRSWTGSSGTVSYSIDNGASWVQIQQFTATTANPQAFSQVIAALAGQPQVKFKWNYTGTNGWHWAIDDVSVTATCASAFPVSVSISASSNPVLAGTPVTFTATPVNGGAVPFYQWKVNGTSAGTNAGTFTYTPVDGDMVTCTLTSYALCITGNPAVSNTVTMSVITVPASLQLQNIIVSDTQCFNATQIITVAGNGTTFTVQNGGSATMVAGEKILYLPGTMVEAGGYMLGYITQNGQYCGSMLTAPMVAASVPGTDPLVTQKPTFRVYPNPTTGSFTLEMTGDGQFQGGVAQICDIRGNKVLDLNLNGLNRQVISLENQPRGMYFIRVIKGQNSETGKII